MFKELKGHHTRGRNFAAAAILSMALTGTPHAAHAQLSAFPGRMSNVATGAKQFVIADVTGDGVPDIVTANYDGVGVAVSHGNADGTFDQPVIVGPAFYAVGVAVADVDGDGLPDIVAIQNASSDAPGYSRNAVSVLHNTTIFGSISFAAPVVYDASMPSAVVLADVNGDGKLDIVTADSGTGLFQIRLNTGTAFAATPISINLPFYPGELAAGDIDGDGKIDFAVADANGNIVYLLHNNGTGTAFDLSYFAYNNYTNHVALADFDGDGKLDIVSSINTLDPNATPPYQLVVLHNNGDMSFGNAQFINAGMYINSITTADVNGDGKPDILTVDTFNSVVSVLTNRGDGTFPKVASYNVAASTSSVAVADVNADGKPDLVGMSLVTGFAAVLTGNGNGTFSDNKTYGRDRAERVAIGDMNRDGIPDLVTVSYNDQTVSILLGRGDATFGTPIIFALPSSPTDVKIADTDGDGIPDILIALPNSGKIEVLRGQGNGYVNIPNFINVGGVPYRLAVDNIDSQSFPDIVVASIDGSVKILYGHNTPLYTVSETIGGFQSVTSVAVVPVGTKKYIAALDQQAHQMVILAPTVVGNTGFHVVNSYTAYSDANEITVGDLNRDGAADIMTGTYLSGGYTYMYGSSNGTFTPPYLAQNSVGETHLVFAEINNDGLTDIVFSSPTIGAVQIAYGKSSGFTYPLDSYAAGSGGGQTLAADLDGDGYADLVTAGTGLITVLHHINTDTRTVSGHITLEGIAPNGTPQDITLRFLPIGGPVIVRHALVGPDGAFTVGSLPKKNYSVHVKGAKYLATDSYAFVADNDITDFNVLLHAGDSNNDNVVDIADFGIFSSAYSSSIGDSTGGYDASADYNADGTVDIADFALLVANYGSTGDL